ncbi:MAG: maleylpyruvate isomerase N-terminal domain-containing protein [Acidimicrobiales bacterium]
MLDLADRLADPDDAHWNAPSLCSQWRVRDVLAHVSGGRVWHDCDPHRDAPPRIQLQPVGGC